MLQNSCKRSGDKAAIMSSLELQHCESVYFEKSQVHS